jgi:hypothetical protein
MFFKETHKRPESRVIVRGLKELYQMVKSKEDVKLPAVSVVVAAAAPARKPILPSLEFPKSDEPNLRSSTAAVAPPSPRKQLGAGP